MPGMKALILIAMLLLSACASQEWDAADTGTFGDKLRQYVPGPMSGGGLAGDVQRVP